MKLVRNNTYDFPLVFSDGCGNVGKTLVSSILEGFEGVEKQIEEELSKVVVRLYKLNKITEDAAIVFLKIIFDRRLYGQCLGRDVNFRFGDVSSAWNYPYNNEYIKRMFIPDNTQEDRDAINEHIFEDKPIFNNMSQNALTYCDILFKTFGNRLKIIYLLRNPVDQVYQMCTRGFMKRIGNCPTNDKVMFEYKDTEVPLFTKGWEEEYLSMDDICIGIGWLYSRMKSDIDEYNTLPKHYQEQVMFISFDELVTFPNSETERIGKFIDREKNDKFDDILHKQNCPRKIDIIELKCREEYIRERLSNHKMFDELIDMYNTYEQELLD